MTREEAIKAIKSHCYFANLVPASKEALDMAIKALEQELVLDKARAEIADLADYDAYTDVQQAFNDGLWEAVEIIDKHKAKKNEV